jgi:Bacterial cellulose synthase subunit
LIILFRAIVILMVLLCAMALPLRTSAAAEQPTGPQTTARKRPLGPDDVVLRAGLNDAWSTVIESPNDTPMKVTLSLDWQTSELVDAKNSSLEASLDGIPQKTMRLEGSKSMRYALTIAKRGFHTLRFRALFAPPAGPCVPQESVWLRFEPSSYVETNAAEEHATVAAFPRTWTDKVRLAPPLDASGKAPSEAAALAFLQADALLRSWGREPILEGLSEVGHPGARLAFRILPFPQKVLGSLVFEGDTLWISAPTVEGFAPLLAAAMQTPVRETCVAKECMLADVSLPTSQDQVAPDVPGVITFPALGLPAGWLTRGEGVRTLRFSWHRPPELTLHAWPTLQLDTRMALDPTIDDQRSSISLAINGHPVERWRTWQSTGRQEVVLSAPIPKSFWQARSLDFEVTVHLVPKDQCRAHDGSSWVRIEASSGLTLPHSKPAREGISDFAERAIHELPALQFYPGLPWRQWGYVAQLLATLPARSQSKAWRFARAEQAGVRLAWGAKDLSESAGIRVVEHANAAWFQAPDASVPMVRASGGGFFLVGPSEGRPSTSTLILALPIGGDQVGPLRVPAPDLRSMSGVGAVLTGDTEHPLWLSFDVPERASARRIVEASSRKHAATSQESAANAGLKEGQKEELTLEANQGRGLFARRHRLGTLAWLIGILVTLALGIRWLRRTRKARMQ